MSLTPPDALATARLVLRRPVAEDAPRLFGSYAQDPEVTRYLTWRPHGNVSESEEIIEQFISAWRVRREFCWFITMQATGELIGSIGSRNDHHRIELGYVLARPYWGRGLMVEAVTAVVDWLFTDMGVFRISALCDTENRASARVLEKAGFEREAILRRWAIHPNISAVPRDCYSYVKVRSSSQAM